MSVMLLELLGDFPIANRIPVRVLLSDIDNTMTSEGMLPAKTLQAMGAFRGTGIFVILVLGWLAGW